MTQEDVRRHLTKAWLPPTLPPVQQIKKNRRPQHVEGYSSTKNKPPPEYTLVGKCEDVCCSTCKTACIKPEECSNCDHVPPPLLRFNYSTRDGEFDPKNSIATYQTTTNSFHGRGPLMTLKEYQDPEEMRTPRFLEMSPISLRMLDQRP